MRHGRIRIEGYGLKADGDGALRGQRDVVVALLSVTHQQTLTFFQGFKRSDEIRVSKFVRTGKEFGSENALPSTGLKEGQHVFLNLLESTSIHFYPGVVD